MENIHYKKGDEALKNKKFEEALDLFTKAIEVEPDNAAIFGERAICYLNLDKINMALFDMDTAIKLQPNYGYRYAARAFVRSNIKDFTGAIKDYEKAIELDPEDDISRNNIGLAQEQLGYHAKAKKNFEVADGLTKTNQKFSSLPKPGEVKVGTVSSVNTDSSGGDTPEYQSVFDVIKKMFSNKKMFKEFVDFIKNGFKLK